MSPIYVETLPPLMVSAKVFREVVAAGAAVRDSFDAARRFAKRLLPSATARFDTFKPLFVAHCDTLLVILFDKNSERFWIAAFYYDGGEPTPPDGPRGGSLRQWKAHTLLASLCLIDPEPTAVTDLDDASVSSDDPRAVLARRDSPARWDALVLLARAFGRKPEHPPATAERDLPKSRSNCIRSYPTASDDVSTSALLDDPKRCVISVHRRSDPLFGNHQVV